MPNETKTNPSSLFPPAVPCGPYEDKRPVPVAIPADATPPPVYKVGDLVVVPRAKRMRNPNQARKTFKEEKIRQLADSIRQHGLKQPLSLVFDPGRGVFIIEDGECRDRALDLLGIDQAPGIITGIASSVREMLETSIVTSEHKESLPPLELARAIQCLLAEKGRTMAEVAARLCLSPAGVSRTLRLLDHLIADGQTLLQRGELTERGAYAISRLEPREQAEVLALVHEGKLVKAASIETECQRRLGGKRERRPPTTRVSFTLGQSSVSVTGPDVDSMFAALKALANHARKAVEAGMDVEAFAKSLQPKER